MSEPIGLSEFMRVNGMDPSAGLRGPMTASRTTSVRAFIRMHTPVWNPTIRGLFTDDDIHHMLYGSEDGVPEDLFNLGDYSETKVRARNILRVVSSPDPFVRMPPPPGPGDRDQRDTQRWGGGHIELFHRWVAGGTPE